MIRIQKFVTEDDVNYYRSMSNDEIKEMLYIGKDRSIFINKYTDENMKEKIMQFDCTVLEKNLTKVILILKNKE
jgi:hypothetical protein